MWKFMVGWILGTVALGLALVVWPIEPDVLKITVEGTWGTVTIVGDDAEAFVDAFCPCTFQYEDTTE